MEIYHVDPSDVRWRERKNPPSELSWKSQGGRLLMEGQIEPIEVVRESDGTLRVAPDAWAYAEAQLIAMMELGWKDILVTY
jgi:hypothetical protein